MNSQMLNTSSTVAPYFYAVVLAAVITDSEANGVVRGI
jgi:hypothetical protein